MRIFLQKNLRDTVGIGGTCNVISFRFIQHQPGDAGKIRLFQALIHRRRVKQNPHSHSGAFFKKIGKVADFVLQNQNISFTEIFQHLVDEFSAVLIIAAIKKDDAVFPFFGNLNQRMPCNASVLTQIPGIHAAFLKQLRQEAAVRAYGPGMINRNPGTCCRNGLVQPLATGKALIFF